MAAIWSRPQCVTPWDCNKKAPIFHTTFSNVLIQLAGIDLVAKQERAKHSTLSRTYLLKGSYRCLILYDAPFQVTQVNQTISIALDMNFNLLSSQADGKNSNLIQLLKHKFIVVRNINRKKINYNKEAEMHRGTNWSRSHLRQIYHAHNSLAPRRWGCNLNAVIFKFMARISWSFSVKLPSGECHMTLLLTKFCDAIWHN